MSFDKTTGKYLGNIGHTGDDPEGYTYATCYVNPKDETLHFFRMQGKKFLQYNNDGEYIELNHTATSRATFAKGAIKAGIWLANKEPKLYTIYDALGI